MKEQNLKNKDYWIGQHDIKLFKELLEGFFIFMKILVLQLYIVISKRAMYC